MSGPYTYINPEEPILPGSYIWWGVSIDEIPEVPGKYTVSPPFKNPHVSPYGNNMIYGSLKDALVAYQESFQPNPLHPRIELRFGGTLRYKFEVCHVVIVCAVYDREDPPLSLEDYPVWDEGRDKITFDPDTNKIERVDDIRIRIRNGIKWRADKGCGLSWDQIVFAFHFKDTQYMICKEGFNHREVLHNCTKTKRIFNPKSRKPEWKCPNDCSN